MRRGLPSDARHVRAAATVPRRGLVLLQARLQGRRRSVAGRVRRRPHPVGAVATGGRRRTGAANAEVRGQRSIMLHVLREVGGVAVHAARSRHVHAWRHGHWPMRGRRRRHGRTMVGKVVAVRASLWHMLGLGRCQGGRSCGGGFLDCATVVVLVTGERRATSKRLLAVGVGALVRPLSRVRSSVASQRAAVAKGL